MSEAQEIGLGKESDPQILAFFGSYRNPSLEKFITEQGNAMTAVSHRPKLQYKFQIVDSPVINAFATPGGYVYFTRGIIAHFNNEAQFAGVLGHEIGHITARHSVIQQRNAMLGQLGMIAGVLLLPQLSQFIEPVSAGMQLALMSFSRDAERQSDKLGVEYSSRVGYDASELSLFFQTLSRQEAASGQAEIPPFLSTHPSPEERTKTVASLAKDWKSKLKLTNAVANRERYLRRLEGMVYGEDPREGFTERNTFYHPSLKFKFSYPDGWKLQNTPQQVQMAPGNGEALLLFNGTASTTLDEAANRTLQQYKLNVLETRNEQINGLPALLLNTEQRQEKTTIRVLVALIELAGTTYSFMGISDIAKSNTFGPVFLSSIRTFEKLTDPEKLNRLPDLIHIRTAAEQMTLRAAFEHFGVASDRYEEVAILNGMDLGDKLAKGTLIKIPGK
jgi:predicted Zn-dependent protease